MNDKGRVVHRSSLENKMKEETLTKIPALKDRLASVRSYL
jgi:hypothetical protein